MKKILSVVSVFVFIVSTFAFSATSFVRVARADSLVTDISVSDQFGQSFIKTNTDHAFDNYFLTAEVDPLGADQTMKWSSSNSAVATVISKNGLVTIQGIPGTATITATAQDGSGVTGTLLVTVATTPGYTDGDANLSDLEVNGQTVANFASATFNYDVVLPFGSATPSVTAATENSAANEVIIQPLSPTGSANVNVNSQDGTTHEYYTINFTVALDPAKAITSFNIATNTGVIDETDHTIDVTVPFGTDVTSLTPTIVIAGASVSPSSGVAQNFINPVTYTVTAADSLNQPYTVTVEPAPTHTVIFDPNGGSGSMSPEIASAPTVLTTTIFTNTGYSFAGWNTVALGGGTSYADGANYDFSADVTLYAQWTAISSAPSTPSGGGGLSPGGGSSSDGSSGGGGSTPPPVSVGQVLGASTGPISTVIPGCDNRTNGFSVTTGQSCVGNTGTIQAAGQVLGAESFHFTLKLKKGSQGNEVMELQKFLNAAGYNCGASDGKFGQKTKLAVIKFEIANNLKGDGIVGAKVRAILNQ